MRKVLVDTPQAFGAVKDVRTGMGHPCDYGYSAKGLGDKTVRENHGVTHGPTLNNVDPSAAKLAARGNSDPFMYVGGIVPKG